MKTIKILMLITMMALLSCEKYLDTVPDNRTEINNTADAAMIVTAAYPKGNCAPLLFSRCDYISDNGGGTNSMNDVNTFGFFWNDVPAALIQDYPDDVWSEYYLSIAQANVALGSNCLQQKTAETRPVIAEAKIVRAYSHFMLANMYCDMYEPGGANQGPGIPYVEKVETTVIGKYERGTVASVYEKIEKDLSEALPDLGVDARYRAPKYHFNIAASHAFATRFYLYKGDYANVIKYANMELPVAKMDPDSKNVLADDPLAVFANRNFQPWIQSLSAMSASALGPAHNAATNPSNLLISEAISYMGHYAYRWRYCTSKSDAANFLTCTNATGAKWIYKFSTYSGYEGGKVSKYNDVFVYNAPPSTSGKYWTYYMLFRIEEILLNRAEAYAMTGDFQSALNDLNVFCRNRIASYNENSNLLTLDKLKTFYTVQLADENHFMAKYDALGSKSWSDDQKALILFILDCRNVEFCYESLRYWDLKRYKIPVTHVTLDGRMNTLYPGDDRWNIQLPLSTTMSGLEQNPRTNLLSEYWE